MLCHRAQGSTLVYIDYPVSGGPWSCAILKSYGIQAVKDVCFIFKVKNGKENDNKSECTFGMQFNDSIISTLTYSFLSNYSLQFFYSSFTT